MSDEAPVAPMSEVIAHPSDGDWLLQHFLSLAVMGLEIGLTVSVGGATISGKLINGKTYLGLLADEVGVNAGSASDDLMKVIADSIKQYEVLYEKPEGEVSVFDHPKTFIHLKDARIFAPGGSAIPGNRGVLWRGRVSAVDGFSLGLMAAA